MQEGAIAHPILQPNRGENNEIKNNFKMKKNKNILKTFKFSSLFPLDYTLKKGLIRASSMKVHSCNSVHFD